MEVSTLLRWPLVVPDQCDVYATRNRKYENKTHITTFPTVEKIALLGTLRKSALLSFVGIHSVR